MNHIHSDAPMEIIDFKEMLNNSKIEPDTSRPLMTCPVVYEDGFTISIPCGHIKLSFKSNSFLVDDIISIIDGMEDIQRHKNQVVEITDLYVIPEARNRNNGTCLIESAIKYLPEDTVIVVGVGAHRLDYVVEPSRDECYRIANEVSKFYEKVGFGHINDLVRYDTKLAMLYIENEIGKKIYDEIQKGDI